MARTIDENKIARIRQSALEMVVSSGYGGASISSIAHHAGVAVGYLYRYYPGKAELVHDLFYRTLKDLADKLEQILDDKHSFEEVLESLIRSIFEKARNYPEHIKFLYVLMHDYSFRMQPEMRDRIFNLCRKMINKGLQDGHVGSEIDEEQVFLLCVAYPLQFINMRMKNLFYKSDISEKEVRTTYAICLKSLKF
jgi:TetR/AcrR family transcriptional regulator, repressor of fatR-cypB operon